VIISTFIAKTTEEKRTESSDSALVRNNNIIYDMTSTWFILCVLATISCTATSKSPFGENESDRIGPSASRQFTKLKRGDLSASNSPSKLVSQQLQSTSSRSLASSFSKVSLSSRSTPSAAVLKEADNEENDVKSHLATELTANYVPANRVGSASRSNLPSIGVSAGGTLHIIHNVIINSAGPIFRGITFGAQLAIACYLAKATWAVMKDVWEEINEEYNKGGGKSGADVREEQDMPYADEDVFGDGFKGWVDVGGDGEDNNFVSYGPSSSYSRGRQRKLKPYSPQIAATRDLAEKLHFAGIPFSSEVISDNDDFIYGSGNTRHITVESVLRSLTRAEGNVLSQTLLTPFDGGLLNVSMNSKTDSADSVAFAAAECWNRIGGLAEAKESLLDLAFPLLPPPSSSGSLGEKRHYETVVDHYGGLLANPPGVLLYGPPGCGKSMLVRALAATVGARFLVVSPSCLLRKYVGETNLNVRALFSVAKKISPCVIFVDELDGLFRERGGEDHDVGRDLKTEFLQLWDGIRNHPHSGAVGSTSSVLVIGASNRPFDVDSAFLRRMPRRVFVGLPDHDARVAVLQSMLQRVPLDPDFDIGLIASKTDGYSPSDIREVLQAAALYPLREARAASIASSLVSDDEGKAGLSITNKLPTLRNLRTRDILRALERVKPTQFSHRYRRDLKEYVRSSGGVQTYDSVLYPSVDDDFNDSEKSTQNNSLGGDFFIADAGTFSGEYYNQQTDLQDSDEYLYDNGSSESDNDDQ